MIILDPTLSEWLNLLFRWIHVFAGIMWVGTTYYFTWLDARLTEEEKAALIKGASQLMLDVLNKPLESTFVVIDEVATENWGWGGLPALEYRRQREAARK